MTETVEITQVDHLEEAKAALAYVDQTIATLDVGQFLKTAEVNALIAIAEALQDLAYGEPALDYDAYNPRLHGEPVG